jgi:hypothetical protein
MSGRKIVHELSDQDLVKLATDSEEDVTFDKVSDAALFIYQSNLKHGTEKISADMVYYTYRLWKGWSNKRQSRQVFFRDFNKFFEKHRTADGMVYYLNPKPFDLSEEAKWDRRRHNRDEKARRIKKTTQG